jgi:hypothetical protein
MRGCKIAVPSTDIVLTQLAESSPVARQVNKTGASETKMDDEKLTQRALELCVMEARPACMRVRQLPAPDP